MMMSALAAVLMSVGLFFLIVATIGFLRLPDVFCRLHITGVIDTLGVPLILLGTAVYLGPQLVSAKLLLGLVFLYGTSPLVGHLLACSALEAGYAPVPGTRGALQQPPGPSRTAIDAVPPPHEPDSPECTP